VVKPVHREEVRQAPRDVRNSLKPIKRLISRSPRFMQDQERAMLNDGLAHSRPLTVVYQFQQQLSALFTERSASQERLLTLLQEWCRAAEATGIAALAEFSQHMRGYALRTA
jgi:stearoyl-CoA desaturase (delta-9 desaturase)